MLLMRDEQPAEKSPTETGDSAAADECLSIALRRFLDGVALPSWQTDVTGEPIYVNPAWIEFTGDLGAELDGLHQRVLDEDRARLQRNVGTALRHAESFECDFQLRRSDGQPRWMTCFASPYFDAGGELLGVIGMCLDLTERRKREEQLAFMAMHDSLTGLPNRRMFESTLERTVLRARRGTFSALLVIDIDNFKLFNDTHGHLDGDQGLINFSLLLQRHVRSGDLLARIGGDEFAVLLEQTSMEEATEIAERMRAAAASEEFVLGARASDLGMSGGLVPIDGTLQAREVFDLADEAMYQAKEQGRNNVVVLTSARRAGETPIDRMSKRVRDALAARSFILYYQPIVCLNDQRVAYFESLVRMVEGDEILMPAEFLDVVERLALMPRLTRLVVGMVMRSLAENPTARVSVNLSRGDLADDSLPSFVDEEMRRQGVDASRLVFEMSEAAVVGNLASARNWIDRLGRLGCSFVLDEFGAGMGLFGLLRELPFDQVKLDGSIVRAMTGDGENVAFVEAVRGLIESQGHTAVAAWVENANLLERVCDAGFTHGQGYHIHVPTPDLKGLIRRLD